MAQAPVPRTQAAHSAPGAEALGAQQTPLAAQAADAQPAGEAQGAPAASAGLQIPDALT